jgi:hypothetical protein
LLAIGTVGVISSYVAARFLLPSVNETAGAVVGVLAIALCVYVPTRLTEALFDCRAASRERQK